MKRNESHACRVCKKTPLTKNELGLTKKLIDPKAAEFFCLECLADYLEVTSEELLDKIEDFKQEGCKLFS
ncbi:MAG: hypothetical protein J6J31_01355 [Thermoguttaceae bacterium]|nr:hypothetical protein [Thermoguttaceae bacterium]